MRNKFNVFLMSVVMVTGLLAFPYTSLAEEDTSLADVQATGVLKVGVEGTYAPYTYHDDDGELVGFDVEVAQAIAEKLGVEAEFTEAEWDSLLAGIDSGRLDTVINAVSITEEREEKYDFAGPYFYITQQIVIKNTTTDINSMDDLTGKKVATNITNAYVPLYEELGVEIVQIDTAEEAATLVSTGRADFCDFNSTIFNEYLEQHPDSELVVAFEMPGDADEFGIPIAKGEESLRDAIQTAVEELSEDGTLSELSIKYFGEDFTQEPEDASDAETETEDAVEEESEQAAEEVTE